MKKVIVSIFLSLIILTSLSLASCKNDSDSNNVIVTFDSRGGNPIDSKKVFKGSKVDRPKYDPKQEGYIFIDWFRDLEKDEPFKFDKERIVEHITLYAKWKMIQADPKLSYTCSLKSEMDLVLFAYDKQAMITSDVLGYEKRDHKVFLPNAVLKTYDLGIYELTFLVDQKEIIITLEVTNETKPYVMNKHGLIYQKGMDANLVIDFMGQTFISLHHNQMTEEDYMFKDGVLTIKAGYLDAFFTKNANMILVLKTDKQDRFITIKI